VERTVGHLRTALDAIAALDTAATAS
jgi:hypothetical protein